VKPWQTPLNKTHNKGEKKKQREGAKRAEPKVVHERCTRPNHVSKPPPITRSILKRYENLKKNRKFRKVLTYNVVCFKIEGF